MPRALGPVQTVVPRLDSWLRARPRRRIAATAATLALLLAAAPAARADESAAYWREQTPARALVAARALQQAGHPTEAAAYYWIYLNTADLAPDEVSRVAALVGELFWTEATKPAEPVPPAPPRPTVRLEEERAPLRDLAQLPAATPTRNWYGWQLILVDAAAIALIASGIAEANGDTITLGALTWVIGLPAVHWTHPRGGSALLGFFLRGGGAALGAAGGAEGAAIGFLIGAAIDVAYLAKQDPPRRKRRTTARLAPSIDLRPGRMVAGLEVSF